MQDEPKNTDPRLDTATLEDALEGSCGSDTAGCTLNGLECNDDACFVTTSEFEINHGA